jgi:hypothetical protein
MIIAVDHHIWYASLLGYKENLPVWVCTNVEAVSGPNTLHPTKNQIMIQLEYTECANMPLNNGLRPWCIITK